MAFTLKFDTRRRVAASARLLLSDNPGEVVAAISAIGRLLPMGMTVHDLIEHSLISVADRATPATDRLSQVYRGSWQQRVRMARLSPHLNDWERGFLANVLAHGSLSLRQESCLKAILIKSEGPRS